MIAFTLHAVLGLLFELKRLTLKLTCVTRLHVQGLESAYCYGVCSGIEHPILRVGLCVSATSWLDWCE